MSPAALRAMRAALDWSMRDLESASGVALKTIFRAEQGEAVTASTIRRLRAAFRVEGVTCRKAHGCIHVTIGAAPSTAKAEASTLLLDLPYVAIRRRKSGTHRVLFEVPERLRPPGWPATRPLPVAGRTGRLDDDEIRAIRDDARRMHLELQRARSKASRRRINAGA